MAVEWRADFQLFSLRMNGKLSTLQLFVRVARTSGFTKAGRELGLSQPSTSRRISELEEEVGAALFVRSTRVVTLTEAGIPGICYRTNTTATHPVRSQMRRPLGIKLALCWPRRSRASQCTCHSLPASILLAQACTLLTRESTRRPSSGQARALHCCGGLMLNAIRPAGRKVSEVTAPFLTSG
ncbi:helix-turn-helix domain-containing protein, partial [Paraburkholderia sediminicola]